MGSSPGQDQRDGRARGGGAGRDARATRRVRRRPRPRPAGRAELPVRAAHAGRRADDGARWRVRDGEPVELEPLQDGGRVRRSPTRSATARRSTRCTPRCARSRDSFGCRECELPAVARAGGARARARRWSARRTRRSRPPRARRCRRPRGTVSVHVVEAARRATAWSACTAVDPADGGLGPGRRRRVHRGAGRRRGAAARARRRSTPAARCRPSAACDPSDLFPELERRNCSFTTEVEESVNGMKVGVPTEIKTDEYRVALTPAGRARAGGPRSRGAGADGRGRRARRSRTPTTRRRARASCPTPRRCSARPRWCSGSRSPSRRRSRCCAPTTCCSPTSTWRPTPS